MARSRGARPRVFVTIGAIKYGFRASAASVTHQAILGHTPYTNQAGVVFGANSPKPNRASKLLAGGDTVSSFIDPGQEASAKAAGWVVIASRRRRGIANTPRARTVYVAMPGGYNYAWNITRDDLDLAVDLGFTEATGTTANLVWGSTPKPPVASRITNGQRESSFIEPVAATIDAAVTAGWSIRDNYSVIPGA